MKFLLLTSLPNRELVELVVQYFIQLKRITYHKVFVLGIPFKLIREIMSLPRESSLAIRHSLTWTQLYCMRLKEMHLEVVRSS
jgi:hypothetical protein